MSGNVRNMDGVSLPARNARKEADALVSRVMRNRAACGRRPVQVTVGHGVVSAGLNGRRHTGDRTANYLGG